MSEWLQNLQAGDKVIVCSGFYDEKIAKVDRVTATQVVIGNTRYQRRSGRMVGADSYSRSCIYEATPAKLAKVRKKSLSYALANYKWHDYTLDDLEAVWTAVKAMKPPTAGEKP